MKKVKIDIHLACIYDTEAADYDYRKIWFAHTDDYDIEKSEWRELYENEVVTAWMPLPEPYRPDDSMKDEERLVL